MGFYSSRSHVFWCIFTFSVVLHCVTAALVRHGLHMFCHFTVLYKLDGDVSQTRAVTDLPILFIFIHYNLVSYFSFASSAVVSWWGCHIVVAFGAFFAPPLLKLIIFKLSFSIKIPMDIVNN